MAAEMAAARQRVLEAPADMVVANHAMGLYELAAIHLSEEDPDLAAARLPSTPWASWSTASPAASGRPRPR